MVDLSLFVAQNSRKKHRQLRAEPMARLAMLDLHCKRVADLCNGFGRQ